MRTVIAIANQKGGVAKTTTACALSAALAIRGYPTLLVDLDQQRNASTSFLSPEMTESATLADVLVGHNDRRSIRDAIYQTHVEGLDLAPASIRLALIERTVAIEEQYRLHDALESLTEYSFIVIDCPPSLGMTLTQALLAASHVLVPIAAQYYPLEGVVDLTETIKATTRPNPNLSVLGYLVTVFDSRNSICAQADAKIREMFGSAVFDTVIRSNVKLQTAPAYRKTIFEHAPQSHGSTDYDALTDELLDRLNVRSPIRMVKND